MVITKIGQSIKENCSKHLNMFVSNAIGNFDAHIHKNIYRLRQRDYKIDNILLKCLNNYKCSSRAQALYCQQW